MKKVFLSVVAATLALAATAQNKAIDALAEKYADREGATVVNLEGDAIKSLSGMVADSDGTIDLGDGKKYPVSDLLGEIVSVTAIVLGQADEAFALEARNAVGSVKYSPIVSHNDKDSHVKIFSTDIKRGKFRGNKEIVVMAVGSGNATVLVRMIGKIDTKLLARMAKEMPKKS